MSNNCDDPWCHNRENIVHDLLIHYTPPEVKIKWERVFSQNRCYWYCKYRMGHKKVAWLPFCRCPCYCTNICIYTTLQTRATFSWPTLYLPCQCQDSFYLYIQSVTQNGSLSYFTNILTCRSCSSIYLFNFIIKAISIIVVSITVMFNY
jgi:hypothetical protein